MIQIKTITAKETYPVRLAVLRKNIPLPFEFTGDFDEDTFHLGAFLDNQLVAVASFMKVSNHLFSGLQYQLRGMATLEKFQGAGAGKVIMQHAFKKLIDLKINCLWCNARVVAVPFYKKLGMNVVGKPFDIEFIGVHNTMVKVLS